MNRPVIILSLVVALLLAGVAPVFAAERVQIEFWHGLGGRLGEVVNEVVGRFNASQSEYQVNANHRGTYAEVVTAAIASYRANNNPHIVQVYEVGTQTMLRSGAIYPVYQLMEDNGFDIDWTRFVGPVYGYYSENNNLYSMPFNSSTPILYYNKDAFAKAGLDPEKPPTTWQEVEEYSRQIIAAGAAEIGFSIGWPAWTMLENMHAWHGQPFATNDNGYSGLDTKLLINGEFGQMHVGKLVEWQKDNIFRYSGRGGDAEPLFINGQAAMFIQSSAAQAGFRNAVSKFEWSTGMLPHWGGDYPKVNSIIGGATLWVLKNKQAAEYKGVAEFLKFIASPELQAYWHKETGYVPISLDAQDLLESEGYLEANPDQVTAFAQLTYSEPTPYTRGLRLGSYVQIRDVLEEELESIFSGRKTVKRGLDDAVRRSNELLEEFALLYN